MLKEITINNERFNSHKKNRIVNSYYSNEQIKLPINNNLYNTIEPNKSIKKNNFNYTGKKMKKYNSISSYIKGKKADINANSPINRANNIYRIEKSLTQKEKNFRRNVSQKIIRNKEISDQLANNVSLLESQINENCNELKKSKVNFYYENKNMFHNLFNDKLIRCQNENNEDEINNLKNEINYMQNKIKQFKYLTELYNNDYMNITEEFDNLQKQNKILPVIINNLEIENKNLSNEELLIHLNIQKIKAKLIEYENNKRKIKNYFIFANYLYE